MRNKGTIAAVAKVIDKGKRWTELSLIIPREEARGADDNLSPSQFVEVNERVTHRPLAEILADLQAARVEREKADEELNAVLGKLNLNGWQNA